VLSVASAAAAVLGLGVPAGDRETDGYFRAAVPFDRLHERIEVLRCRNGADDSRLAGGGRKPGMGDARVAA